MSEPGVFDLKSAYAELNRACSLQAYEKVINISGKILSKHPSEAKAFQCKLVALIRTEKYEDGIGLIRKFPNLAKSVIFEKAYIEYRLNRIDDAFKTLGDEDTDDLRVLELRAQLHYRKEQFTEAYDCLRRIIRNSNDDFGEERLTNLAAVAASASCFSRNNQIELDISPETYEAKFNLACYHLGKGNIQAATSFLTEAEECCRESMDDDPDVVEDDIEAELSPIKVQHAYILQLQKKDELANQIYQSVTKNRSIDPVLLAVTANNVVCINREQNIFDSRKRIKMASVDELSHKLFRKQLNTMLTNQGLFYWYTNQVDACRSKVRSVLQQNPGFASALLLEATLLLKDKQYARAINALQTNLAPCKTTTKSSFSDEVTDPRIPFAIAQCSLRSPSGQVAVSTQAVEVARLLGELLPDHLVHSPGVISTRIALYLAAAGDTTKTNSLVKEAPHKRTDAIDAVTAVIENALSWYESKTDGHSMATYDALLTRLAHLLQHLGQPELAAKLYERQLAHLDSRAQGDRADSRQALVARLVRAYAQFDSSLAEATCRVLFGAGDDEAGLEEAEVDALEQAFLYGAKAVKRQAAAAAAAAAVSAGSAAATRATPAAGRSAGSGKEKDQRKGRHVEEVSTPAPPPSTGTDADLKKVAHKKKKKRKIRLPKNCVPGVMPDPERWLPRRERAQYRGKRYRDKRHAATRGPQGQVTGGADLDAAVRVSKQPGLASPRAEVQGTPGDSGSSSRQPAGAGKPHRKAGRRKGR